MSHVRMRSRLTWALARLYPWKQAGRYTKADTQEQVSVCAAKKKKTAETEVLDKVDQKRHLVLIVRDYFH